MGVVLFWLFLVVMPVVLLTLGLVLAWRHDQAVKRRGSQLVDPKHGLRESRRDLKANPELNRLGNQWR